MKIKKMNGIRNVILTTIALVLALSSIDGLSQTKFKKVIKDGKVTYLPVDNAETSTKQKASGNSIQTNSKFPLGNYNLSKAKAENTFQTPNKTTLNEKTSDKKTSNKKDKNIVLFESNQCGDCRRIRRFFYKNKIAYTRKDIDLSKKFRHQLALKTGATETPALYINNKRLEDLSSESLQSNLGVQQKEPKTKIKAKPSTVDDKKFNKSIYKNKSRIPVTH